MKAPLILLLCYFLDIQLPAQEKYELTVARDGSGDYTTIQAAVDACKAFPDSRVTVFIRNGIYHEKVLIPACNTKLSLIGESREKTVISYNDYFDKVARGRNSTFYTYTLMVEADDFCAANLTIENTAGPVGQAVALHVSGNRCAIRNCNILGNQDTLYATGENSRQYFTGCLIEGTTDFIFGSATGVFDKCTIRSKADSYITAASTTEGKNWGFVFIDCKLIAAEGVEKVYLGRPWRDFAKVAFIRCDMGEHILPQGWSNWAGTARERTAFFAEYNNTGAGYAPEKRVRWSHQLSPEEVE
ncbi:MAG: pectinesterase family protein, partial [Bacteroidales bacterium]